MISQKEAVYSTVVKHRDSSGNFDRAKVITDLAAQFGRGDVEHSDRSKIDTDSKCRAYCSGLLSNWLRKDTRLHGTEAFSSTGRLPRTKKDNSPADPEMKRLMQAKALLQKDGLAVEEIDDLISKRELEIAKAKGVERQPARDAILAGLAEAGVDLSEDTRENTAQED